MISIAKDEPDLSPMMDRVASCGICYEYFSQDQLFSPPCCFRVASYCRACLKSYYLSCSQNRTKLNCPSCKLPWSTYNRYLADEFVDDKELIERYNLTLQDEAILLDKSKAFCPNVNCTGHLAKVGSSKKVTCNVCKETFCFRCKSKWSVIHNCISSSTSIGESISVGFWSLGKNVKRCPSCSIVTEKTTGCNHMTCSACRFQYCWLCGSDWTGAMDRRFSCRYNEYYKRFICPVIGFITAKDRYFGFDPITRTVTKTVCVTGLVAGAGVALTLGAVAVVTSPITVPIYYGGKQARQYWRTRRQRMLMMRRSGGGVGNNTRQAATSESSTATTRGGDYSSITGSNNPFA